MSESAILAAIRAAVATQLPDSTDRSDRPEDTPERELPAFMVFLDPVDRERLAMGSDAMDAELDGTVELYRDYAAGTDPRAAMTAEGEALTAALRADTALAALCDDMIVGGPEVQLATGKNRVARLTVKLAIRAEI